MRPSRCGRPVSEPDPGGAPEFSGGAVPAPDRPPVQARRLRLLAAFGARSLAGGSFDTLLQDACLCAAEGLGVERVKVLEYRSATDDFLVRAGTGWPAEVVGRAALAARSPWPSTSVFRSGQPLAVEALDPAWIKSPDFACAQGAISLLSVPIRTEDVNYGVLEVDTAVPRRFDENDREFLLGLAQVLAAAIQRSRIAATPVAPDSPVAEILESIDAGFYALDHDGRFTYINRKAEELSGFRREDLLGKVIWDVLPDTVGGELHDAHRRAVAERRPVKLDAFSLLLGRWVGMTVYPNATGLSVYFRDITERKQTEEALRRSERELRRAQTMAKLGHWTWTPDRGGAWQGGVSEYAPTAAAIFGAAAADLARSNAAYLEQFVHPDDRDTVRDTFRHYIEADVESYALEYRILRADGAVRWVRELGEKIRDATGALLHTAGTVQDITDLKETEAALRERDERLRAALLASSTGTYRWDSRRRVLDWDDSLSRLFGVAPGDASKFLDCVHPEDRAALIATYERSDREGCDFAMDYRIIRPDGSVRWISDRGKFVFDSAGRPLYMTGACTDITERKQAEAALRASEEKYRSLYVNTPAMMQSVDGDRRLVSVSNLWLEELGYARDEVIGRRLAEFLTPGSRWAAHEVVLPEFFRTGRCRDVPYQLVKKSGEVIDVLLSATAERDSDGSIVRSLAVLVDVTERNRAEAALRAAKENAEEANRSKSRFLAAASHDLRQPLQVIGALLGSLSRIVTDAEARRSLHALRDAHRSMGDLLDTLLDIDRLERGDMAPTWTAVPMTAVLETLRAEFAPLAHVKGLDYRVVCSPWSVRSSPGFLQQILRNLVSNAIKYTDRGTVLVGCRRRGAMLRLEVWDTGIGIAAEHLERIFEEFYQVENRARRREEGLGLGLAIAKRLADLLGHALQVRSVPGRGTVFTLAVPIAAAEASVPPRCDSVEPAGESSDLAVLLIEDDPAVLDSLWFLLRLEGFSVLTATSGAEALAQLSEAAPPATIVTDYSLPGETGVEVLERVRERTGRRLPCIVLTGDVSQQHVQEIEQAGCALLHKPADPDELVGAIRRSLRPTYA